MVPLLAGLAAGIALDEAMRAPPWFWPPLAACTVALVVWGARRGLKPWGNYVLAAILLAVLGGLWHEARCRRLPPGHLKKLDLSARPIYVVRGRVDGDPVACYRPITFAAYSEAEEEARFWLVRVQLDSLSGRDGHQAKAAGGVALFVNNGRPDVAAGDHVEFLSRLAANRRPTNPGERDRAAAYERMGSHAKAGVARPEALRITRPAWYSSPSVVVGRLRRYLDRRLDECLARADLARSAALIKALLFGQRDALKPDQRQGLGECGVLHFLAISGLHVGIFCLFVSYVLAFAVVAVRLRTVLVIGLVWAYVTFTGLHASSVRAGWMLSLMLAAPLLGRQRDPASAMAGAAFLILLVRPQELFSAGFQLTFTAVWAIACVYPQMAVILWPWEDFLSRARHPSERSLLSDLWLCARSYLLLSFVVWIATAPLLAFHFNIVSLAAPLLNLFVWPVVLVLLLVCFLLVLLLPLGGTTAGPVALAAAFLSRSLDTLVQAARALPGFGVHTPSPPLWWVGLYYCVLAIWAVHRRLPRGRAVVVGAALVLGAAFAGHDMAYRLGGPVELTVADVGPGQAALLRLPGGQAVLFDAGSMMTGRREAVAEMLWDKRIGRLSAAVVSHYNVDHCNFIPFLNERFLIDRLVLPQAGKLSPSAQAFRRTVRQGGLDLRFAIEGDEIASTSLRCRILHPNARFLTMPGVPENDRSLVVLGECAGMSFLLTGDIQSQAIRRLCEDHPRSLKADVLIMPHHGDYREGLEELLRLVRPSLAVVSGLSAQCDPGTRDALARLGIPLWITEVEGAIMLTVRPGRVTVTGYKSGRVMVFEPAGSRPEVFGTPGH
jgi:competence protein ComEC